MATRYIECRKYN